MHADDLLVDNSAPGPEPEARRACEEWLISLLQAGPVPSGDLNKPEPGTIRAEAKQADFKWATVRRAADHLGVRRERDAFTKAFVWRLPKVEPEQHENGAKILDSDLKTLVAQDNASCCSPIPKKEQHEQQAQSDVNTGLRNTSNHVAHQDSVLACACAREGDETEYVEGPDGELISLDRQRGEL